MWVQSVRYNLLSFGCFLLEYFIIPYTSTLIRLSHLYQEFCAHCIVIMNNVGSGWWVEVDSYQPPPTNLWVWVGGQGWVLSHFLLLVLLSSNLLCSCCCYFNLISGFFAFFWFIAWADGINKSGWCLAGGRGCWLKGLIQIPSVSWLFHHSLHFHIY